MLWKQILEHTQTQRNKRIVKWTSENSRGLKTVNYPSEHESATPQAINTGAPQYYWAKPNTVVPSSAAPIEF
jgi:hypothetical protein